MPGRVPELDYGDDVVVRRISQQGSLKMNGVRTFLSEIFAHERMGLRALDERYFEVLYGPVIRSVFWTPSGTSFTAR